MNRFVSTAAAIVATWALAAMPLVALARGAHAQGVTIRVGDLSNPAAAAAFDRQVEHAANKLCADRAIDGLSRLAACHNAVRAEAMDKLGSAQRTQVSMTAKPATPSAS